MQRAVHVAWCLLDFHAHRSLFAEVATGPQTTPPELVGDRRQWVGIHNLALLFDLCNNSSKGRQPQQHLWVQRRFPHPVVQRPSVTSGSALSKVWFHSEQSPTVLSARPSPTSVFGQRGSSSIMICFLECVGRLRKWWVPSHLIRQAVEDSREWLAVLLDHQYPNGFLNTVHDHRCVFRTPIAKTSKQMRACLDHFGSFYSRAKENEVT